MFACLPHFDAFARIRTVQTHEVTSKPLPRLTDSHCTSMTHVTRWSSTDVADWLEQCLHLPGGGFRDANIDGTRLLSLDDQQLTQLGLHHAQVARLQTHISAFRAVSPVAKHQGAPKSERHRDVAPPVRPRHQPDATHALVRQPDRQPDRQPTTPNLAQSKGRSSSVGSQVRCRTPGAVQELVKFSRQIGQLEADKETAKILEASRSRTRPSQPSQPSRCKASSGPSTKGRSRSQGAQVRTQTPTRLDAMHVSVPLWRGLEQYRFGRQPHRPKMAQKTSATAETAEERPRLTGQELMPLALKLVEAAQHEDGKQPEEESPPLTGEELMPLALKIVEAAQQSPEPAEVKQTQQSEEEKPLMTGEKLMPSALRMVEAAQQTPEPEEVKQTQQSEEEKLLLTGEKLMPLALRIVEAAQHSPEPEEVKSEVKQEKPAKQPEEETPPLTGEELMPLALKIVETAMGKGGLNESREDPKDAFQLLADLSQGLDGSEIQTSPEEAAEAWRRPSVPDLPGAIAAATELERATTVTPTSVSRLSSRVSVASPGVSVSKVVGRSLQSAEQHSARSTQSVPSASIRSASTGCCQRAAEHAAVCLYHCGPAKSQSSKGFKFSKGARKELVRSVSPCTGDYTPRFRDHIPLGTFTTATRWPKNGVSWEAQWVVCCSAAR
eukprot:Skav218107  [mRNA]  locus=scaffold759:92696:94693:- [translate_table: standard]